MGIHEHGPGYTTRAGIWYETSGDMLTGSLGIKATERLPDGLFYYIDSSEDVAKDAFEKMKTFLESLGFYNVDAWGSCGFGEEFGFHFVLGSYEL